MKQHLSSTYEKHKKAFVIWIETNEGGAVVNDRNFEIYAENSEITRACINRIVDNLNKLAEHSANNGGINEV